MKPRPTPLVMRILYPPTKPNSQYHHPSPKTHQSQKNHQSGGFFEYAVCKARYFLLRLAKAPKRLLKLATRPSLDAWRCSPV